MIESFVLFVWCVSVCFGTSVHYVLNIVSRFCGCWGGAVAFIVSVFTPFTEVCFNSEF